MAIKAFINKNSGGVEKIGAERIESLLFHEFLGREDRIDIVSSDSSDLDSFCESLHSPDVSMALVAGGDGTIARVAAELAGGEIPLAILPAGTMNLLAYDLGIGGDMDMAIKRIAAGVARKIDIAFVNDNIFLNNIVFGAYARLAEAREHARDAVTIEERIGALTEAADAAFSATPREYLCTIDGEEFVRSTNIVMIANNRYTGAVNFRPQRDRLDEGRLAIYFAESDSGADLMQRLFETATAAPDESDAISYRGAREMTIRVADDAEMFVAIDGEPIEISGVASVSIKAMALPVICSEQNGKLQDRSDRALRERSPA